MDRRCDRSIIRPFTANERLPISTRSLATATTCLSIGLAPPGQSPRERYPRARPIAATVASRQTTTSSPRAMAASFRIQYTPIGDDPVQFIRIGMADADQTVTAVSASGRSTHHAIAGMVPTRFARVASSVARRSCPVRDPSEVTVQPMNRTGAIDVPIDVAARSASQSGEAGRRADLQALPGRRWSCPHCHRRCWWQPFAAARQAASPILAVA